MADLENIAFSLLKDIPDDSEFVHDAMHVLGFFCEFSDLTTDQMQIALAVAQYLKGSQRQAEFWES